jgi:hypothetical protein
MNVQRFNIFEKRYSQISILSGFDIIKKKHSNLLNIVREEGRLHLPSVASGEICPSLNDHGGIGRVRRRELT